MGHAGRDNWVCLDCGATHHHKGKCDQCGGLLKADRFMTEDDFDRLGFLLPSHTRIKGGQLSTFWPE